MPKPRLEDAMKAVQEAIECGKSPGQVVHGVVDGVPVVTIPTSYYRELLAQSVQKTPAFKISKAELPRLRRRVEGAPLAPRPSSIERDPEVAALLRERFKLADTLAQAQAACRERFGDERTPSVSRIALMRNKVRAGG